MKLILLMVINLFTLVQSEQGKQSTLPASQKIIETTLCELSTNSERNLKEIFRVTLVYFTNREYGVAYDSNCIEKPNHYRLVLACKDSESCKEMTDQITKSLRGDIRWARGGLTALCMLKETNFNIGEKKSGLSDPSKLRELEIISIEKTFFIKDEIPWPYGIRQE